jgi:glycosyltransferase involved in cell wall biosynthesis
LRRQPPDHIHAHFADRAALVALVAGRLLDLPFSFTAHANDIYVDPVLLPEKLSEAKFVATCTRYNRAFLSRLGKGQFDQKIKPIYHGLDPLRYRRNGHSPPSRPLVLSVGQLKEKKGFIYLLRACAWLRDRGYALDCQIVGAGPLQRELQAEIGELSLQDTVRLLGALPHDQVIDLYHRATIFVLPAVLGGDGDRDGIPNVILEALASGLPVISTRHSGIPEVIEDGTNGLLVPPGDDIALATAIAHLLDHPDLGQELARKGMQAVAEKFSLERNVHQLLSEFIASTSSASTTLPRG